MDGGSEVWLSRKEAAKHLTTLGYPVSHLTLQYLGCTKNSGKGPPYRRFGWRTVRYRRDLLEEWAQSRTEEVR